MKKVIKKQRLTSLFLDSDRKKALCSLMLAVTLCFEGIQRKIYDNEPLAPHTTMAIGGNAKKYVEAESVQDLIDALALAHGESMPIFILGAGSNTLIHDNGFDFGEIHIACPFAIPLCVYIPYIAQRLLFVLSSL